MAVPVAAAALAAAVALVVGAGPAEAGGITGSVIEREQSGPVLLRTHGAGDADLFKIAGAAFLGPDLVVVTAPEPAVHVFSAGRVRQWGKKGSGPAELLEPSRVAVSGGRILIYDLQLRKIASYTPSGEFVAARPAGLLSGMAAAAGDTVVAAVILQNDTRMVLRLRGTRQDTVWSFGLPPQITLRAEGSPSLTLPAPFAPLPQWALLSDGRVVRWNGRAAHLEVYHPDGRPSARYRIPPSRQPVGQGDREEWLSTQIPADFMGQRVFEPLRAAARREVRFPDILPPVLAMLPDPESGVWLQQTTRATGELWSRVVGSELRQQVRLPPGRTLLAVGRSELAALHTGPDGVEVVEIYAKNRGPQRL